MGSQVLEILRQGTWASLTGGWFYDPHQNLFSNTFHLYLWLFLLCFPFTLYMWFLPTLVIWGAYCAVVVVLFTVIKVTNYRLHAMFDTSECLQDSSGSSGGGSSSGGSSSNCSKSGDHDANTKESSPGMRGRSPEGIEMQTLNSKRASSTPPVQCSSRNSLTEDELVGHQHLDSASIECRCFPPLNPAENGTKSRSSTIDLKVDVHRNNSSGSSEDGLMKPIVESAMVIMTEEENVPENPEERFEELYEVAAGSEMEPTSAIQRTNNDDTSEKMCQVELDPDKSMCHQQSTGSLTTVSSVSANDVSGTRRYSNLSNLALSRPNSCSASSAILKETGSLEQGLVMENVCARQRFCFSRQARRDRDKKMVRRSRSALETGPSPHSHPGGLEMLDSNGGSFHASRRGSGVGKVASAKGSMTGRNSEFFLRSSFSEDINPIVEAKDELSGHNSGNSQCSESQIDVIGNCGVGVQGLPVALANKGTDWGTIWGGFLARHQSFDAGTSRNCDRFNNSSQNGHKAVSRKSLSGRPGTEDNRIFTPNEIAELQARQFRTLNFKTSPTLNSDLQSSNSNLNSRTNVNSTTGLSSQLATESEMNLDSSGTLADIVVDAVDQSRPHSSDSNICKTENEDLTPTNTAEESDATCATSNSPTVVPPPFLPFDVVGVPSRDKAKCSSPFANQHQSNSEVLQQPAMCQSIVSRTSLKLPLGAVLSSAEQCALDCLFSPDDETSIASSYDEEVLAYLKRLERVKPPLAEGESIVGSVPSDLSLPSPSTPGDNWSVKTKSSQGAIPKRKPPQMTPEDLQASASEKRPSSNLAEGDAERRLLRRRLLEILYRPELAEVGESSGTQDGDLSRITEKSVELETSTDNKEEPSAEKTPTGRHGKIAGHRRRHHGSGSHSAISNTSTELSSLLPSSATSCLQRSLERSRNQWRMGTGSASSSLVPRDRSQGPPLTAIASMLSSPGAHLASSHDDTTTGAVHCFQDERGNWLMYSFDENSSGVATDLVSLSNSRMLQTVVKSDSKWEASSHLSSASSSIGILEEPCDVIDINECFPRPPRRPFPFLGALQDFRSRQIVGIPLNDVTLSHCRSSQDTDVNSTEKLRFDEGQRKPKYFYKFFPIPCKFFKVRFDRLALLAMLDRNLSVTENVLVILLAALVGALGGLLLSAQYFHDFWIFLFCFVIASCQYSLIKGIQKGRCSYRFMYRFISTLCLYNKFSVIQSVQPDAASPIHGYNRVVAFSRPIYFCICCSLVIILQYCLDHGMYNTAFTLYGLPFTSRHLLSFFKDLLLVFILCFPIIFSFGLLPQINTFLMYFCEQVDMHMFGGNAVTSLTSAFYCVTRSLLSVCVLYGIAYGGLREPTSSQHIMFSIFCGLLVPLCYHLSRSASDPSVLWSIVKSQIWSDDEKDPNIVTAAEDELLDPLPSKMRNTVLNRLRSDVIICPLMGILVFAVHVSTVFTTLQPLISYILYCIATVLGIIVHYLIPQMRKQLPWLFCSHPLCKSHEFRQFEVRDAAKIMWYEKLYAWLWFVERNIVYPVVILSVLTRDSPEIIKKFGVFGGSLVVVIACLKCLRLSFSDAARQHQVLIFTVLFFRFDYRDASETFLIDYFIMSTVLSKFYEFILKIRFVITYIAPWQITWGSAFHAFAQPFSVPHSAMLFLQAAISAILSTPLNPVLGSAIFITSYVRPVKFWERDYNTKRVDHTNTRLSTHLERNPGADDNNLNSIFYEHLARSLQHSLCGDIMLGRWGNVSQGDCYVLASDYLNCLVHITELANGLVSFQVRGLEFRGTYCQQREVEAISEGVDEDDGCCCCEPGHIPHALSVNAAFNQRWLAWEVIVTKYVLEGYSISDNSAASMFQVFDLRKVLITYYVKSIVYYILQSAKLEEWLSNDAIVDAVQSTLDKNYADVDPVFNMNVDEDYDFRASGVSRNSFCNVYYEWIQFCASRRENPVECGRDSVLVSLCFALSILGRRALGAAAHNYSSSVDFFLYGLHALFKGDFRITSVRDEWVFVDMELLRRVVAPGVRMALKLHQDHFTSPDEYDDPQVLYSAINTHEQNLVISHEGDPAWRNAVLSNKPSLLALRHVVDDGSDEYKIIMLNKRYLSFRVIKVNRECVRGLWAGQQQELVYLRNRNPERGSIQNAKQALRNLINSSCDQPIGYPIYVSPLTTSYADTNAQLCSVLGGSISFGAIQNAVIQFWCRMRRRCGESCSSGGSVPRDDICIGQDGVYSTTPCIAPSVNTLQSSNQNTTNSHSGDSTHTGGSSMGRGSLGRGTNISVNRGSLISNMSSVGKPSTSTLASMAAGLLSETSSLRDLNREVNGNNQNSNGNGSSNSNSAPVITMTSFCTRGSSSHTNSNSNGVATSTVTSSSTGKKHRHESGAIHRVKIIDPSQVYDTINLGRRIDVQWPDELMRQRGGKNHWKTWTPERGMEGSVVHRWVPCHKDPGRRSHVDRTIMLVKIDDKFVPIGEGGVQYLGAEV